MKVLELRSNTVIVVNDSYGARMIEQGKAVIPSKDEPQEAQEMPAEEAAEEAEAPPGKPRARRRSKPWR